MSVTLDELLLLVGRLDDAPGFDTPRERFRRYVLERVADLPSARALIDDCQRSVGEQRHRALQDLVTSVGRLIGFEVSFGAYDRSSDGARVEAQWRSPGQLTVVLDIKTDQSNGAPLERLARAVAALPVRADSESRIGLCVVARQYAARGKLAYSLAADAQLRDLRMMSVQSLLTLAAQVTADRMTHHEVVKLLKSGFALDFVIDLLDRPAAAASVPQLQHQPELPVRTAPADRHEPGFWVATITGRETTSRDRLLESVIAHRRVLAICHAGRFNADGSPGDWVCFFLPGKGIVGHAQLISLVDDGAAVVRQGNRFSRVYRLADVTLYDQPVAQALRPGRPFALPPVDTPLSGACLTAIAKHDFLALTTYRDAASRADRIRSATA